MATFQTIEYQRLKETDGEWRRWWRTPRVLCVWGPRSDLRVRKLELLHPTLSTVQPSTSKLLVIVTQYLHYKLHTAHLQCAPWVACEVVLNLLCAAYCRTYYWDATNKEYFHQLRLWRSAYGSVVIIFENVDKLNLRLILNTVIDYLVVKEEKR